MLTHGQEKAVVNMVKLQNDIKLKQYNKVSMTTFFNIRSINLPTIN